MIKELERKKQQEAEEREKLEQKQKNNGDATIFLQIAVSPHTSEQSAVTCDLHILALGRAYTVSVALPGSVLDNAQSAELRTYLAGQIARACVVFCVDEIVVFDEQGDDTK